MGSAKRRYYCAFCGKEHNAVQRMLGSPLRDRGDVHICDECIRICAEIIASEVPPEAHPHDDVVTKDATEKEL